MEIIGMNTQETKQHVRDTETAKEAVEDCANREYNPKVGFWEIVMPPSYAEEFHDQKVYDAAYQEAKKMR